MGHIQTYASQVQNILSTEEMPTRLKQGRAKNDVWCFMPVSTYSRQHLSIYMLYMYIYIIHIYNALKKIP